MVAARITSKDITQAGSVAKLVASLLDTLKTAPMDLREVAAAKLMSLSDMAPDNAALIGQNGIAPLVALLVNGSTNAQAYAAAALANCSRTNKQRQLEITKAGGMATLASILRSGGSSAQEAAAAATAAVTEAIENQSAAIKAGAVIPLVALLKSGTLAAQIHASRAVGNLCKENPSAQEQVLKEKGTAKLLGLLSSGKTQVSENDLQPTILCPSIGWRAFLR